MGNISSRATRNYNNNSSNTNSTNTNTNSTNTNSNISTNENTNPSNTDNSTPLPTGRYNLRRTTQRINRLNNNTNSSSNINNRRPRTEYTEDDSDIDDDIEDGRRSRPRYHDNLSVTEQRPILYFPDPIFISTNIEPANTTNNPTELNTSNSGSSNNNNDNVRRNVVQRILNHLRSFQREQNNQTDNSDILSNQNILVRIRFLSTSETPRSSNNPTTNNADNANLSQPTSFINSGQNTTTNTTDNGAPINTLGNSTGPVIRFEYVVYFLDQPANNTTNADNNTGAPISSQLTPTQISQIELRVQNLIALYTELLSLLPTLPTPTALSDLLNSISSNYNRAGTTLASIEEQLPRQLFRETGLGSGFTCSICLQVVGEDENTRKLPCGHLFHLECIDAWLQRCNNCPLCRSTPISGNNINNNQNTGNTNNATA